MSESTATVISPPPGATFQGEGWHLRLASSSDSAAIHELLRTIPYGGPLAITEDRGKGPERLRAFEAHGGPHPPLLFLMEDTEGQAVGCLSMVARRRRLGADRIVAGHLSDLRVRPSHRKAKLLPGALRAACDLTRERTGAEVFYTACLDYDRQAFGALTHRDERRYQQPMSQVMHQLSLAVIPLNAPLPADPQRRIERGSKATLGEIGDFLSRTHATSTLGQDLSGDAFAERLHHATTGLLERVFLVRESGTLVCCGAVLGTGSMRRFALGALTGAPRSTARWFNLNSWTGGYRRLPIRKGPQATLQLGFVAQRDDDPGPLRDLLMAVLAEPWPDDADWLTMTVPRQGQSAQALEDVPCFQAPVSLMAVTRAGTRWNNVDFRTQRCGVEHVFL